MLGNVWYDREVAIFMYFVYILKCKDRTLYTGITTDVARRLEEHKSGKGSHYTRARGVERVLYLEECEHRSAALKREAAIKKMSRVEKMALITQGGAECAV